MFYDCESGRKRARPCARFRSREAPGMAKNSSGMSLDSPVSCLPLVTGGTWAPLEPNFPDPSFCSTHEAVFGSGSEGKKSQEFRVATERRDRGIGRPVICAKSIEIKREFQSARLA